jgi:hypothetical protein
VVGRAVPPPPVAPKLVVPFYRPYVFNPYFSDMSLRFYYGDYPHMYPYGYYGYLYPPYMYVWGAPGEGYGSVRLDVDLKEAAVYVDGYYVGIVDDFDGAFHQLNLTVGPHRIEIREDGYETLTVDVNVQLAQTIRYRGEMKPVV